MSILNNDILSKEYDESNVPITLPLLYKLGWRFTKQRQDSDNVVVIKQMDTYPIYGSDVNENPYWMHNSEYRSIPDIHLLYTDSRDSRGMWTTEEVVWEGETSHNWKIIGPPVGYQFGERRIYTWQDLETIKKIGFHRNNLEELENKLKQSEKLHGKK